MLSNINGAALNMVNCLSRLLSDSALVVLGWVNTLAVVLMPSLTHPGQCFSKIWRKIISVYWWSVFTLMQFDKTNQALFQHSHDCLFWCRNKICPQIGLLLHSSKNGSIDLGSLFPLKNSLPRFCWIPLTNSNCPLPHLSFFFKDQIGFKSKAKKKGKI